MLGYNLHYLDAPNHPWISSSDDSLLRLVAPARPTAHDLDDFLELLQGWYLVRSSPFAMVVDVRELDEFDGECRAHVTRHMKRARPALTQHLAGTAVVLQSPWIRAIANGVLGLVGAVKPLRIVENFEEGEDWAKGQVAYLEKMSSYMHPPSSHPAEVSKTPPPADIERESVRPSAV